MNHGWCVICEYKLEMLVKECQHSKYLRGLRAVNKGKPPSQWTKISPCSRQGISGRNQISKTKQINYHEPACQTWFPSNVVGSQTKLTFNVQIIPPGENNIPTQIVSCSRLTQIIKLETLKKADNVFRWCHWNELQSTMTNHSSTMYDMRA